MDRFTLRQLRYFEALARLGHFGRAAEACAISQPALSVQIKDLEEALGIALFERGPRKVQLTSFGGEFLGRVRSILSSVDELEDLARASQAGFVGRLRLGIIPTIAPYLLPTLLRQVSQHFAKLDVHIRETITPRLIDELNNSKLDAAVVALPVSVPSLVEVPLFSEAMMLVRPSEAAHRPVPGPDELIGERLLLLEEGHCFRDQALSFCNVTSGRPRDGLDGTSLSTLVQMVSAGIGVTLIPEMAAPVETGSANVSVSRFPDPQPQRSVGMIWRKSSPLGDQLHSLAGVVQDAANAQRASNPLCV